jgi:nitrogen fixation NifU-like protein
MTDALYHAIIVEHAKHPHRAGTLAAATHTATLDNPMCGDFVAISLVVVRGAIADVAHSSHGCALSIAAASMLADRLVGKSLADAARFIAAFDQLVTQGDCDLDIAELRAFAGVHGVRSRRSCATLAARAIGRALR